MKTANWIIAIIVSIGLVAYAFASNILGGISQPAAPFTVYNIAYTIDTASPPNVTSVSFGITRPSKDIKVSLFSGGALQDCWSAEPLTHWTCEIDGVTVEDVTALRVVGR